MPSVTASAPGEFAVELNGEPVTGGVLPNSGNTAAGPVVVTANAGDRISIVNTSPDAATIAESGAVPTATLYIQSLATGA